MNCDNPVGHRLSGSMAESAATGPHGMPWSAARALASRIGALPTETLDLADTLAHSLGAPLRALVDLPPFHASAMDGWVVAGPGPWRLVGERHLPGAPGDRLVTGTAAVIATGARIPDGATAVLRRESGWIDAAGVLKSRVLLLEGKDIRRRAAECHRHEFLLPTGTLVTPRVLALAAASGHDRLAVHRRPRVEVLVLGNELLRGGLPRAGWVRDALGPSLGPWLMSYGASIIGQQWLGDDADALRDVLRSSAADMVVTTGGTSMGPADFVRPALAALGAHTLIDSVAVRPGHPMLLAELPAEGSRARLVLGLPGNPLAAAAAVLTLAEPMLCRLGGRAGPATVCRPAAVDLAGHGADTRLVPVGFADSGVVPLGYGGPAMLRGLAEADALAVVPPDGVVKRSQLQVLPLPSVSS